MTSALALVLVFVLIVWCWRKTSKGDWIRYAVVCSGMLLLNEALLGALLVLLEYVGVDKSAGHAAFLCLHFGNTLLLLAALALTAKGLSRGERLVWVAKPHELMVIGTGLASVTVIGMTGSLAALADTIFPLESVQASMLQDLSPTSHFLLRLRLLHPIAAVFGASYILWVVMKLWRKRERSESTLSAIGITMALQIGLGVLNVVLLAPIWLQMAHLFVADVFWILLVVSSAEFCLRAANSQSFQESDPL
jgi:cytochrome c oxidase assembly protein subunit 15